MGPSRPRPLTLDQVMLLTASAAAVMTLSATVVRAEQGADRTIFLVGFAAGYVVYLVALTVLALSFLTRPQALAMFAIAASLSALLLQVVAAGAGWAVLVSVFFTPIAPFLLGGYFLRQKRKAAGGAGAVPASASASESQTMSRLVRDRRARGLSPQPTPPSPEIDDRAEARSRLVRRTLAVSAVILAFGGVRLIRRRAILLEHADRHANQEQACLQAIRDLEAQALPAANPEALARRARDVDAWTRKAEWHARKRDEYLARSW